MYTHLTQSQRCIIFGLKASNYSLRTIAKEIAVAPSTVSRELIRNSSSNGLYEPYEADVFYKKRRRESKDLTSSWTPEIRAKVIHGLSQYYSPVQIAGYLKRHGFNINHETIYQFIWQDKRQGGTLYRNLRRRGKRYIRRGNKHSGRGSIPGRVDIEKRPQIVETKSRIGDFEGDTIVSKDRKGAIVTLVDRCSKMSLFKKVERATKELVTKAIVDMLKPYKKRVHTITFDNGREFAGHQVIAKALRCTSHNLI